MPIKPETITKKFIWWLDACLLFLSTEYVVDISYPNDATDIYAEDDGVVLYFPIVDYELYISNKVMKELMDLESEKYSSQLQRTRTTDWRYLKVRQYIFSKVEKDLLGKQ